MPKSAKELASDSPTAQEFISNSQNPNTLPMLKAYLKFLESLENNLGQQETDPNPDHPSENLNNPENSNLPPK